MDRYSQSGLTQKEFCAQQGLTLAKFGYWRRRWKAAQDTPVSPGGFLPLSFEGALDHVHVVRRSAGFSSPRRWAIAQPTT